MRSPYKGLGAGWKCNQWCQGGGHTLSIYTPMVSSLWCQVEWCVGPGWWVMCCNDPIWSVCLMNFGRRKEIEVTQHPMPPSALNQNSKQPSIIEWSVASWLVTSEVTQGTLLAVVVYCRVPTDQGNQGIQGNFWRLFPVREIREKQGFFSQNQGKKFQIRELFFQTISKPFKPINLRKMFFKTVKPQELSGNCNICID